MVATAGKSAFGQRLERPREKQYLSKRQHLFCRRESCMSGEHLHHELLESQLEIKYNLTISEAHAKASEQYDWWAEVVRDLGEGGEPDGLL